MTRVHALAVPALCIQRVCRVPLFLVHVDADLGMLRLSPVCVLLKPPPSAHSFLNLQIQLVNYNRQQQQSNSHSDLSRPSSESSFAQVAQASTPHQQQLVSASSASSPTDENGPSGSSSSEGYRLTRTNSGRSNRSSSGSSFFSTASRRATTPLYNFEFHRVLPTVITDAGG